MSCNRPTYRLAVQRGFTLIETMVAGVLLSILVLGLMGLMTSSAKVSNESIIRQKAIFVLNGEMERLSAMYALTGFGEFGPLASYNYPPVPDDHVLGSRFVYRASVAAHADEFMTSSTDDFKAGAESLIFHHDPGLLQDKRNYVWVDRDRGIAGRLSWTYETVIVIPCTLLNCGCLNYNGTTLLGSCGKIELILEYPFRFDESDELQEFGELTTLTLKTIVARRDGHNVGPP